MQSIVSRERAHMPLIVILNCGHWLRREILSDSAM